MLRLLFMIAVSAALPAGLCAQLPRSVLSVDSAGHALTWWRSHAAPAEWHGADRRVADRITWQPLRPGLEVGTLDVTVNRGLLTLRVVIARADLRQFDVALEQKRHGGRAAWTVDSTPAGAALALNAGQFAEAGPWGWLVTHGVMLQPPAGGPLSAGIAWAADTLAWIDPAGLPAAARRRWQHAFQSYPVLLRHGRVPESLLGRAAAPVDLAHRDIRLALGFSGDTMIVLLTRFRMGGGWLSRLPAGLTVPETAALLGALGARDGLMLDGGLSAQMLARAQDGTQHHWRGLRRVPLALYLIPRGAPRGR